MSLVVAGRTDRGVHALGQVVSYDGPVPSLRSVNGLLPREIAVLSAEEAPPGFNARYDATSRTYRYRLHTRSARSPFELGRALWWPRPLDRALLEAYAAALVGEHDFRAFTPSETRHRHFRRTVLRAGWEGDDFVIEADAFLRSMIRVSVGTMLEQPTLEEFVALLDGAPRSAAGRTAPAHGLYLESVAYPGMDAGLPIAYLALEEGTPVFTADGERIGTVEHVLADDEADIFDGLLIDMDGGGHRFADAEQVGSLFERRAELRVVADALTEPSENAATMRADPDDTTSDSTRDRLRRAWDYLSGRY